MEKEKADVVIFYAQESFGGVKGEIFDWHMKAFPFLDQEQIRQLARGGCLPTPWGKAYRRELWDGGRFPVHMYSEDRHVEVDLWNRIKKAAVLPYVYYYWELSPHGSASAKWNSLQAYGLWSSWKKHEELTGIQETDRVLYLWNERMSAASAVYHQGLDHFLSEEQYGEMMDTLTDSGVTLTSFTSDAILSYYHYCWWKVICLASALTGNRVLIDSHFLGAVTAEDCLDHALEGLYRNRFSHVLSDSQTEELLRELKRQNFPEDRICRTMISYVEYQAKKEHAGRCEERPPFWPKRACRYAMQILALDSVDRRLTKEERAEMEVCIHFYRGPASLGYRWMRRCIAWQWQWMLRREGRRLMKKLSRG